MIRKTIKGGDFNSQMVGELVFDQVPEEGSFNPVTSDGIFKAIGEAKEDMQGKIDEVTLDPSAVALGNVHLLDEVTEFPADGSILIDSETNGPGEMSKDTLLELTAQNAVDSGVAVSPEVLSKTVYRSKPFMASYSRFTAGSDGVLFHTGFISQTKYIKAVFFQVVAGQSYHIEKSVATDRFVICVMTVPPDSWADYQQQSYPLIFNESETDTTSIDIVSPANGWMIVGYTATNETCDITVSTDTLYTLGADISLTLSEYVVGAEGYLLPVSVYPLHTGYYFQCKAGCTYVFRKSNVSNRFRCSVTQLEPKDWVPSYRIEVPFVVNYSDSSELTYEVTAPCDGYMILTLTSIGEDVSVKGNPVTDIVQPEVKDGKYVLRSMPIDPNWPNWSDVRYYYGFDKLVQPIFNTIHGVLETDTMLSVRGGKGRWNTAPDFVGGHILEGWDKDEKFRVTLLMGKFTNSFACLQVYSPAGLSEEQRRFGWLKLGSDELSEGVDFSRGSTIFYTPLTLNQRSTPPTSTPDADLNPQLSNDNLLDGTMYYDTTLKKVRVMVNGVWKSLAFEE